MFSSQVFHRSTFKGSQNFLSRFWIVVDLLVTVDSQLFALQTELSASSYTGFYLETIIEDKILNKNLLAGEGMLYRLVDGLPWMLWRVESESPPMTGGKSNGYGGPGKWVICPLTVGTEHARLLVVMIIPWREEMSSHCSIEIWKQSGNTPCIIFSRDNFSFFLLIEFFQSFSWYIPAVIITFCFCSNITLYGDGCSSVVPSFFFFLGAIGSLYSWLWKCSVGDRKINRNYKY